MSKKVLWPEGKYQAARPTGSYSSIGEMIAKSDNIRQEQERAMAYLEKAIVPMVKLLEIRLSKNMPLYVMRPLSYLTSALDTDMQKSDPIEDSFYNTRKSSNPRMGKFVDVVKTINPGTQLMLKGLDPQMREFLFVDAVGNEHAISYDDRNKLLTQTDIFETVQKYFEKEEN